MAREQAEHFWPWKPKAEATTCDAAKSKSASSSTTMKSLPPISRTARLTQSWPGRLRGAFWLIRRPTSFEPVKAMNRICGCSTMKSPISAPEPGR